MLLYKHYLLVSADIMDEKNEKLLIILEYSEFSVVSLEKFFDFVRSKGTTKVF